MFSTTGDGYYNKSNNLQSSSKRMSHDSSTEEISRNATTLKRTNSSSSKQISTKKAATFKSNNSISDLYLKRPGSTRREESFGSPGSTSSQ